MNKVEILEEIIRQKGGCLRIICYECPLSNTCNKKNGNRGYREPINWKKDNLKEAKEMLAEEKNKEMNKFKVGDWARIKNRQIVRQIVEIQQGKAVFDKMETLLYPFDSLELVCGFVKGEDVEVTNNKIYWTSKGIYKFYSYDATLYNPYLVKYVSEDGKTFLTCFKYCRKVQPKYKAYTEFDAKWIGEKIYYDDEYERKIVGWQDGDVLLCRYEDEYCYYSRVSLEDLVKEYTKDGKPFGELIC